MKRICVLLVGMVVVWGLCSEVSAQGLFGNASTPGSGGFPCTWESGATGMPSIYVGWLDSPNGSTWAIQRNKQSTGTAPWSLKGLWLGATKDFNGCNGLGFVVSGSIFVPQRASGTWALSPGSYSVDFNIPSYDWWSVDGLVTSRISGACELVAGFRWDHTSTEGRL